MTSREMYRDRIIENYKNPSNFGDLENPSNSAKEFNPSCGDEIKVDLLVKRGKIEDIRFSGEGCAISMASASLLTENVKGMSVEEAKNLKKDDILEILGINVNPARIKCALLGLDAIKKALG